MSSGVSSLSCANVLETLRTAQTRLVLGLTRVDAAAQTRLVLQTATYRRQLETLLKAQTRLVLQTAIYRRQKRKKHADRHKDIDAMKWRLEHRAVWG